MHNLNPAEMTKYWHTDSRWKGTKRPYSSQQVEKLRGSVQVEHTLARLGAERLWWLLQHEHYVPALGALTGNQAVQQVQAGRKFQADDYTFVSASGNTYSYPRRLHVSDHTKEAFQVVAFHHRTSDLIEQVDAFEVLLSRFLCLPAFQLPLLKRFRHPVKGLGEATQFSGSIRRLGASCQVTICHFLGGPKQSVDLTHDNHIPN